MGQCSSKSMKNTSEPIHDQVISPMGNYATPEQSSIMRMPCIYINHGGGPMPLLGQQPTLAEFLSGYLATLPQRPSSILVATAHWETKVTTVSAGRSHNLLFDYGGFPRETYQYKYPAPGNPALAERVKTLLFNQGLPCELDQRRGWDHGVFVPMMLMSPDARIPVVAMSLLASQDAKAITRVGQALQPLRDDGVLIVGSGVSFHNMQLFFSQGGQRAKGEIASARFDDWLTDTLTSEKYTDDVRREKLLDWEKQAPSARDAHPHTAAEHFMPLFVVFGAGGAGPCSRKVEKSTDFGGFRISQFEFT